eukprot:PhF_6_TR11004/c0_g1_i1/m.17817
MSLTSFIVLVISIGLFHGVLAQPQAPIVIIDTDMDIDDVAAFNYLFRRPRGELDVRLITVAGNSWAYLSSGVMNLYNLLHNLGRDDVDVGVGYSYAWRNDQTHGCKLQKAIPDGGADSWGAHGGRFEISMLYGSAQEIPMSPRQWKTTDLGAVDKIRNLLNSIGGRNVTLLSIGGMTTFGTYFQRYPEDLKRVDRLYIMGGAVNHPGNVFTIPTNPYAEFNIYVDVDAAAFIVKSQIPTYLVPLDVTNTVPYTTEIFNKLIDPTQTPAWLARLLKRNRKALNMTDPVFFTTIYPWDEFATAVLADANVRSATKFYNMPITVVTQDGEELGRTKYDQINGTNIFVANETVPSTFWSSWFSTVHN